MSGTANTPAGIRTRCYPNTRTVRQGSSFNVEFFGHSFRCTCRLSCASSRFCFANILPTLQPHAFYSSASDGGSGSLQRSASLQTWKYFRYPLDSLRVSQRRCGRGGKQERPFSCQELNAGSPGHICHFTGSALLRVTQQ
jgi:hypothetical protein